MNAIEDVPRKIDDVVNNRTSESVQQRQPSQEGSKVEHDGQTLNVDQHLPVVEEDLPSKEVNLNTRIEVQTKGNRRLPLNRKSYTGDTRLVVGFDIGTTWSGISYCIPEQGQVPEVHAVNRQVLHFFLLQCRNWRQISWAATRRW